MYILKLVIFEIETGFIKKLFSFYFYQLKQNIFLFVICMALGNSKTLVSKNFKFKFSNSLLKY